MSVYLYYLISLPRYRLVILAQGIAFPRCGGVCSYPSFQPLVPNLRACLAPSQCKPLHFSLERRHFEDSPNSAIVQPRLVSSHQYLAR